MICLKGHEAAIKLLEAENKYLHEMLEIEKKRANNAVDQMLITAGSKPVTPLPADPNRTQKMLDEVSAGLALVGGEMGTEEEEHA